MTLYACTDLPNERRYNFERVDIPVLSRRKLILGGESCELARVWECRCEKKMSRERCHLDRGHRLSVTTCSIS
jgi:hypothetical protein